MPPTTRYFLEQALELFGNVCQQVHVCGKDGICERIAIDGTNELDKPHGAHGSWSILPTGNDSFSRRSASPI